MCTSAGMVGAGFDGMSVSSLGWRRACRLTGAREVGTVGRLLSLLVFVVGGAAGVAGSGVGLVDPTGGGLR